MSAALSLRETLPPARRRVGGISSTQDFPPPFARPLFCGLRAVLRARLWRDVCLYRGFALCAGKYLRFVSYLFSLIFASNAFGIILTSQISGRLVGRVQPRKLLAVGLGGSLTGGLVLLATVTMFSNNSGLPGVLMGFWLVVASVGFIAPNATALALTDHARVAGSASALVGVLQYIIGAAVTPLVSIGGSSTAKPLATIMAVLGIGAVFIFVFMTSRAA